MELIALRLIHVLAGIFWVGSGLFTTFFLLPVLAQAGPAAGPVLGGLQQRRLLIVLPVAALLTIGSGLRLMWITSAGFSPAYFGTPTGQVYALSGLAAVLAFLLALFVARPAAARAAQLGLSPNPVEGRASSDEVVVEIGRLRRRAALSGAVVTLLLTAAAGGMAIGRYV